MSPCHRCGYRLLQDTKQPYSNLEASLNISSPAPDFLLPQTKGLLSLELPHAILQLINLALQLAEAQVLVHGEGQGLLLSVDFCGWIRKCGPLNAEPLKSMTGGCLGQGWGSWGCDLRLSTRSITRGLFMCGFKFDNQFLQEVNNFLLFLRQQGYHQPAQYLQYQNNRMTQPVYNFPKFYERALQQLSQNSTSRMSDHGYSQRYDQGHYYNHHESHHYGQYKLQKPKNPLTSKSIYTMNESQFPVCTNEGQYEDGEDIYAFIENSKTLKDRIEEKLNRKYRNKSIVRNKIVETTFRPSIVNKSKENTQRDRNNITARSKTKDKLSKNTLMTERKRVRTEIEEAMLEPDRAKKMTEMGFYQRQDVTVARRKQYAAKMKQLNKQNETKGCTFRPKLSKYIPRH